jgi:hypothetical protein
MILTVGLISLYVNGNVNNLKYKKMGLGIKPTLRSTLENKSFQEKSLSKAAALKPASKSSLMKKGGKIIKKAQNGIVGKIKSSFKKAGADLKQADRDYKSSDSVRKLPITGKTLKEKLENSKSNRAKADSLYNVAKKREAGEMKKGGKMIKKAKNGTSFGMLSVKAGIDKNPKPTAADRIAGAKKQAKSGTKMMKKGGKCKNGC